MQIFLSRMKWNWKNYDFICFSSFFECLNCLEFIFLVCPILFHPWTHFCKSKWKIMIKQTHLKLINNLVNNIWGNNLNSRSSQARYGVLNCMDAVREFAPLSWECGCSNVPFLFFFLSLLDLSSMMSEWTPSSDEDCVIQVKGPEWAVLKWTLI